MFSHPYPIDRSFPLCLLYGLHASAKKYVSSDEIVLQLLVTCSPFLVGLFCFGTLHTFSKHPLVQFPVGLQYFQVCVSLILLAVIRCNSVGNTFTATIMPCLWTFIRNHGIKTLICFGACTWCQFFNHFFRQEGA